MAALTADKNTPARAGAAYYYPVEAAKKIYAGAMVVLNAAGNAEPATSALGKFAVGIAQTQVDNTSGAAGAVSVTVKPGVVRLASGTAGDAIAAANLGSPCWLIDDQTVGLTDGGGTRSFAGTIVDVETAGVWVNVAPGQVGGVQDPAAPYNIQFLVRGASTGNVANLAAFTVANDGITLVAGNRVLLKNQSTASQNGIYIVGTVAAGVAPLTRAPDFAVASDIQGSISVAVQEGTAAANQTWILTTANPITVGTTNLTFQQEAAPVSSGTVTLAAGTATVAYTGVTANSRIFLARTSAANCSTTVQYAVITKTAGTSFVVNAQVAAGTIQNTDTSTLDWFCFN